MHYGNSDSSSKTASAGSTPCAPHKPLRSLLESRNSLADGLDHLQGTLNMLDSLLDSLRSSPPRPDPDKQPVPSGQIQNSLDTIADVYQGSLNRLRRRIEEVDSVLGTGLFVESTGSIR